MMNVIECRDLTKTYYRKKALNGLSFSIEENKIIGLIGRNGAGKTTLLKIMAGLIKETSGEIKVISEKPFNSLQVSQNSIFMDEHLAFPPALQLQELLEEAGRFYPNWNHQLAQRLFAYFGFDPKDYHNRLSKGKTSVFNAIIGISARCPITIFDEPTSGMDEVARKDFYRALLKDYITYPRTIILSSHHLDEVEDLLEEILLLKDGRKLLHMSISKFKEWAIGFRGKKEVVKEWIGNRDLIYSQYLGIDTMYGVVKNEYSEELLEKARMSGLEVSPVRSSDLCVYLMSETKGGIDDVFNDR
ncbi:ATP-binding cassette domain-containing protein [Cytobacillus sp. Hz8]|uniref:ATP-binding cassette domain-containing protein n=1 Tax=Cytobacillus sp. Hz8 TaxID=3347168 RepID=UPI0035E39925